MANDFAPTITLNNGVDIPQIGYGVFLTPPEETERAVLEAFEVGYRHVDTAQAYRNEEGVGAAVAACGLPREDVFLTTKVWISNAGDERAARSIDGSLRRLGTDYIDLLLVHQPFGDYYGTYRAMEKALAAGKVRAIGVSNFFPDRFVDLAQHVEVPPAVNQMETHVFNQQADNRAWYAKYGTALESWGPLAQGRNNIFTHPVLSAVGEKHGKTAARWPCATSSSWASSSSPRRSTASAWSPTSTSPTSGSTTPTCIPLPRSTRGRASSTTTTPRSRSASPPSRSRRTDPPVGAGA